LKIIFEYFNWNYKNITHINKKNNIYYIKFRKWKENIKRVTIWKKNIFPLKILGEIYKKMIFEHKRNKWKQKVTLTTFLF
jgi:hypothetical protein